MGRARSVDGSTPPLRGTTQVKPAGKTVHPATVDASQSRYMEAEGTRHLTGADRVEKAFTTGIAGRPNKFCKADALAMEVLLRAAAAAMNPPKAGNPGPDSDDGGPQPA